MKLADVLDASRIHIVSESLKSKTDVLLKLLDLCLENSSEKKHKKNIQKILIDRENSMSTGIGYGVAIPHCSSQYLNKPEIIFARLNHAIDFQSLDKVPVQICILVLFPQKKFDAHITLLSCIAKLCNDETIRKNILEAKDENQIFEIIQKFEHGLDKNKTI